jgi:hypothetical protein
MRAASSALVVVGWALTGCVPATVGLNTGPAAPVGETPQVFDDREWATVLRENVKSGLVDYPHLLAHRESLEAFLQLISVVGPKSAPQLFEGPHARLAYYVNAYNAGVLKAVVTESAPDTMYPPGKPALDHRYHLTVDRKTVSLHDLRVEARAAAEGDPRVEFALCAAALGSPPLADQPWRADMIPRQLDDAARLAMDNPRMVFLDHAVQRLLVGLPIDDQRQAFLDYYAKLTGAPAPTMLNVLLMLASGARREWLNTAVGYPEGVIPFDRALNKAVSPQPSVISP